MGTRVAVARRRGGPGRAVPERTAPLREGGSDERAAAARQPWRSGAGGCSSAPASTRVTWPGWSRWSRPGPGLGLGLGLGAAAPRAGAPRSPPPTTSSTCGRGRTARTPSMRTATGNDAGVRGAGSGGAGTTGLWREGQGCSGREEETRGVCAPAPAGVRPCRGEPGEGLTLSLRCCPSSGPGSTSACGAVRRGS